MPLTSQRCPVLQANVTCVTDFEGQVSRIICPEYEDATGTCRMKRNAQTGGRLSQLLERLSENTLDDRSTRCDLR